MFYLLTILKHNKKKTLYPGNNIFTLKMKYDKINYMEAPAICIKLIKHNLLLSELISVK